MILSRNFSLGTFSTRAMVATSKSNMRLPTTTSAPSMRAAPVPPILRPATWMSLIGRCSAAMPRARDVLTKESAETAKRCSAVAVGIDGAAADLASDHRVAGFGAVGKVHLAGGVLVTADADVWRVRRDEHDRVGRVGPQGVADGVVDRLRAQRRDRRQVEQADG